MGQEEQVVQAVVVEVEIIRVPHQEELQVLMEDFVLLHVFVIAQRLVPVAKEE